MRKMMAMVLCFTLIFVFGGCSDNGSSAKEHEAAATKQAADGAERTAVEKTPAEVSGSPKSIDVDLTELSSTMIYSEVYNMMSTPDDYVGKTVKMEGMYSAYHDDKTGKDYFSCIIQDAAACCAQGIEFELSKDYSYPDDYPKEGEDMTVVGTFDTYMEGENMFFTLREARLV